MSTPLPPRIEPGKARYVSYISYVVPATCVLAILHFGQDFLKPLAIAGVLSLVIAPLVRKLSATGLGRTVSTLISVAMVAAFVAWMSAVIAMQLVSVASDLPQYRSAIKAKAQAIRRLAVGPFEQLETVLKTEVAPAAAIANPSRARNNLNSRDGPVQVEVRQPAQSASDMISKLLSALWGPLGEAGIVFVLLVFILLEHESLGDRFIRLVGESEMGSTVQALTDAAQGVSRYFLCQFVVNATFGVVLGVGLWAIGIPHAALWGVIGGLLRFIPYVGVLGAAALIAIFSAAVDPGWAMVLYSMSLLIALELLAANVIEPQVYGHSTGLAPLAVIVSALFWGAIWGPIGLLLSTPLTLCLVVIGRQVTALAPLTILLSESPGLSAGQRFYQRALMGDVRAIVRDAQTYLRRRSFAKYCDQVLLPGMAMGALDLSAGKIEKEQSERIRTNIVMVAESITSAPTGKRFLRRLPPVSLVNANVGSHLRRLREERLGKWQGALDVPLRSIVLCMGFGTERDDILCELLVRALREDNIDARSASIADQQDPEVADKSVLVGTAFLMYPTKGSLGEWVRVATEIRAKLPHAIIATIKLRIDDDAADPGEVSSQVDLIVHSYTEAEAFVLQSRTGA